MSWCLIVALICICLLSYESVGCLDILYCKVPCSYNFCPNFSVFFLSLTMYLWLSAWCTWCGMRVLRHTCGLCLGVSSLLPVLYGAWELNSSGQACAAVFASCTVSPIRVEILSATGLIVLLSFTTGLPSTLVASFLSLLWIFQSICTHEFITLDSVVTRKI